MSIKENQTGKFSIGILRLYLILLVIFAIFSQRAFGQDPTFTQFQFNPIYYNPALVGVSGGLVARTNYRNFWHKVDNGFNTIDFSIDTEEPFLTGGMGMIALRGVEGNGVVQTNMIGFAYSYNLLIKPRKAELQMGLQGAWVQKKLKTDNLIFSDQIDAIYGVQGTTGYNSGNEGNVNYPDFASGLNLRLNFGRFLGYTAKMTLNSGFAMHHITRPNQSFSALKSLVPIKYVGYTYAIIRIETVFMKSSYLTPGFLFEAQDQAQTLILGSNVKFNPLILGLWYRTNGFEFGSKNIKALTINAGIELGDITNTNLRINYSYDINLSQFQNLMGDSHEISVILQLNDYSIFNTRKILSRKARQNRECFNKF